MSTVYFPEFGIMHFDKEVENINGSISSMTLGHSEDMRALVKIFDWLDERKIDYTLTWKMVKTDNDSGGYFYRLSPGIWILDAGQAIFFKLVWG